MSGPTQRQHDPTVTPAVAVEQNGTGPSVDDLLALIDGVNPSGREIPVGTEPPSVLQLAKALIPGVKLHRAGGSGTTRPVRPPVGA